MGGIPPSAGLTSCVRRLGTVCLPWTNLFLYFLFNVSIGLLLKGMVESSLLFKDEPLTSNSNIDKVMGV